MMLVLLMVMNIDCYFEEGDDDDGDVGKLFGASSLFIM